MPLVVLVLMLMLVQLRMAMLPLVVVVLMLMLVQLHLPMLPLVVVVLLKSAPVSGNAAFGGVGAAADTRTCVWKCCPWWWC